MISPTPERRLPNARHEREKDVKSRPESGGARTRPVEKMLMLAHRYSLQATDGIHDKQWALNGNQALNTIENRRLWCGFYRNKE
jgi:hypothetical protein